MNDLEKYFYKNVDRVIHKFPHYFEIYDRYFARFRGTDVCLVEVGVGDGGSLQMWKHYFGPKASIFGIDISVNANINERQIQVIHGDQGNVEFLKSLPDILNRPIDILIDDGSHVNNDQILTFEILYPQISNNGIYLCEDVQTSYQEQFGGGYLHPMSFVSSMKSRVDELNAWAAEPDFCQIKTDFTRVTYAMHFYPYMVVIEKRLMDYSMRSPVVSGGIHVRKK